ncbi:MAG TPA: hypothetical protein VFA04_04845 [Bryobacteraceae bacterium]|nr:hypothetical protein [Bryobacteraceae bacterium]
MIGKWLLAAALALPAFCAAETWNNVPLVDVACSAKVKANPDAHTRSCAMQCSKSGYGIVASDGSFLRLDAHGNEQALEALKSAKNDDHLRVTVTGARKGDTIQVESLKM